MADENEHSNSKFPSKMLCDGRQFKKKNITEVDLLILILS